MSVLLIPDFDKKIKPTKKQLTILENIRKCKNITDYLNYRLNKNTTKRAFATHIRDYFLHLGISNINDYFKDPRRMSNSKRLDYTDKIEQDIESYNNSLKDYSGSYRLSNLSAIRKLLEYNKIELGNSFWEGIRKTGSNADRETDIQTPTREQLRNILNRGNNESKAFFLMQMTSGSRIEEIRTLTFDNLYMDTFPPSFRVTKDHSKSGKPITKYFSDEAKQYLIEYLEKDRGRILKTRINRAREKKVREEYNIMVFPMGKTNPETMWSNLCKKEGLYKLDPKTKHPVYGTHSLRRFFEDNIGEGKLSKYMLNKLSKSEEPYSFKTKHKLEKTYLKYMDNLYIFETPKKTKEEVENLKNQLNKKVKEIEKLQKGIGVLEKGRKSFEEKYNQYDNRFKQIEERLNTSLNPETKKTKSQIDFIENLAPVLYKLAKGKDGEPEQIEKIKEVFRKVTPQVLQDVNKLPKIDDKLNPDVVSDIIQNNVNTDENLEKLNPVEYQKKKKQTKY